MSLSLLQLCIVASLCALRSFEETLRYFEILNTGDIISRRKRSASGTLSQAEVSFRAFGRQFDLLLNHGYPESLSEGFQAKTVDKYDRKTPVTVNPEDFFTGHLVGDVSVRVSGHYEDGLWVVIVWFPSEIYVVEPAWRHLPHSGDTMLIYRASDVIWNHSAFPIDNYNDGLFSLWPTEASPRSEKTFASRYTTFTNGSRKKRFTSDAKTCLVLAILDYEFYRDIARSTKNVAINFVTGVMTVVGRAYRETEWEPGMTGYELKLGGIHIHTDFTTGKAIHYNVERADWKGGEKHYSFQLYASEIAYYCLGHLYTGTSFTNGLMGLANLGRTDKNTGLCGGAVRHPSGKKVYANSAFTTTRTASGKPMSRVSLHLINAHEYGHNWGAEHDPSAPVECAPSNALGGKYLMFPGGHSGTAPNNLRFSPCSKRQITPVIKAKSCFVTSAQKLSVKDISNGRPSTQRPMPTKTQSPVTNRPVTDENPKTPARPSAGEAAVCGNAVLEKGEVCDAGTLGDSCCSTDCKLRGEAVCSDFSSPCCRDCKVAPKGLLCSTSFDVCKRPAYCDGRNPWCPQPELAADKTPCRNGGHCHNGTCLSFCHVLGQAQKRSLLPCMCDLERDTFCRRCCQYSSAGSPCEPTDEHFEDGEPCRLGFCKKNVCMVSETNEMNDRSKETSPDGESAAVAFLRSNVVLFAILLSLMVVVAVVKSVNKVDRSVKEQRARVDGKAAGSSRSPPAQAKTTGEVQDDEVQCHVEDEDNSDESD